MSEDQELDYVNDPEPTAERHNPVRSGRRMKVTVLRVAVVLAVALIVAYVFDGVALFLNIKERPNALSTSNMSKMSAATAKTATTPPPTMTTSTVSTCVKKLLCDTGWELKGQKCYFFSTNKLTWSQSKEKCLSTRGRLVKIDSRLEQIFLYNKSRSLMTEGEDKFWIGLTDSEAEGVWKWTDGSSLDPNLTFWFMDGKKKSEPDNWKGHNNEYPEGEDCVRMGELAAGFKNKCWFDKHCNTLQKYICDKNPTQSRHCQ